MSNFTGIYMICTHCTCLFSGRDKKTSSSMSRSSSGFESSHLPSPEYPALPLTLTSTSPSKTLHPSKPGFLPCILPSVRTLKSSVSLLSPGKGIARSRSCTELRRNPTPGLLRRCFSLTGLHKEQSRKHLVPKDWKLTARGKNEESTQHKVNLKKHSDVMFTSCQSSTASFDAVCSTLNKDTTNASGPKQAETTQSAHLQLPATVPAERTDHPVTTLPVPYRETACRDNYTGNTSSEDKSGRFISASLEARRLKTQRNKKKSINSVNLGSLVE